jgi:hypothetical protein
MVRSYYRGHEIYYDSQKVWRYTDNDEIVDDNKSRPCPRCGMPPTTNGYDYCIGYLPGVISACCGHGVCKPILIQEGDINF